MARTMEEKNTGIYRTVVRTEFLKDSKETYAKWDYNLHEYVVTPEHAKGDVITEIFGPYVTNAQNQNYSIIRTGGVEETEEVYPDDFYWEERRGKPIVTYVRYANVTTEHQKLAPVFALQPNGSLTMELDWVKY